METAVAALIAELAAVAGRTSMGAVLDRIRKAKATENDQDLIAAQDEIINDLIADKNDLVRLAESLREQFVAQQISSEQLAWLSDKLVPLFEKLLIAGAETPEEKDAARASAEQVKELLDPELLLIAQVLGFNYKYAIGEALSELAHQAIVGIGRRSEAVPSAGTPAAPTAEDLAMIQSMFGNLSHGNGAPFGSGDFPRQ